MWRAYARGHFDNPVWPTLELTPKTGLSGRLDLDRAQELSVDKIMARHRRLSFEFKRQVVLDFLEGREGMRELARKHSLSRNLLRLWVQKYEAGELTDEVVDAVRIAAEYEGKIAELERKVGQLTMEVDLLVKGVQLGRQRSVVTSSIVSGPKASPVTGGCRTMKLALDPIYYYPQPPLRCGGKIIVRDRIVAA